MRPVFNEGVDDASYQSIPEGPVPISLHESYYDANGTTIADTVGVGVMKGEDMHINMTIRIRTYNEEMSLVSDEIYNCKAILTQFAKLKAMISELTEDKSGDAGNQHVLAYKDWGTFTRYYWRSKRFVKYPGSGTQFVKYDHPDNYYTYHREQWNLDWDMYSSSWKTRMYHYGVYQIYQAKTLGVLGGLLGPMAAIMGILEIVLAQWLLAILALFLLSVAAFTILIVETEQGDGWGYLCGPGDWPYTDWWWVSFGLWRDLWWLFDW